MSAVTRSALHTMIFKYVSACPGLRCVTNGVFQQFSCIGYTRRAINAALTDLLRDGVLRLDDSGILSVGDDSVQVA